MKGKTKLDDLNKVFSQLEEKGRDTLFRSAKKLLKAQKLNNEPNPPPIAEKKKAD
ncbi:hypothetical protein AGMMS49991_06240 [Spirochaetia bacterium]|nr:hypothetical protein AGMMS49991_06240 [Spirochaetia bacterium]